MKFLRIGAPGSECPAAIDEQGQWRDLSSLVPDIRPDTLPLLKKITPETLASLPILQPNQRIGPVISHVPNFYCIGLNYHKPGASRQLNGSSQVVITSKASSALSGANDPIYLPADSHSTDWEVELGVLMAREAWRITEEQVDDYILGYCIVNDLCEREYMFEHGGQWIKGKSVPGYGPSGPYLVTTDELKDPQNLQLTLSVNEEVMQDCNSSEMITGIRKLISHMSHYMKLLPGDLIATGTPPGIGLHRQPPLYLKEGDRLKLSIEGLGEQNAEVRREQA